MAYPPRVSVCEASVPVRQTRLPSVALRLITLVVLVHDWLNRNRCPATVTHPAAPARPSGRCRPSSLPQMLTGPSAAVAAEPNNALMIAAAQISFALHRSHGGRHAHQRIDPPTRWSGCLVNRSPRGRSPG